MVTDRVAGWTYKRTRKGIWVRRVEDKGMDNEG
jgi:hypothetical protein